MGKASSRKKDLKYKKIAGQVFMHSLLKYRGCNVYIRQYGVDIFQYDAVIDGQIYSDYNVFTPVPPATKLTDKEVHAAVQLTIAAAFATVDVNTGAEQSAAQKAKAEEFLKVGEEAFGGKPAQS